MLEVKEKENEEMEQEKNKCKTEIFQIVDGIDDLWLLRLINKSIKCITKEDC